MENIQSVGMSKCGSPPVTNGHETVSMERRIVDYTKWYFRKYYNLLYFFMKILKLIKRLNPSIFWPLI